ncbi:transglutaminase domain-containing protein [Chitinophaga oryzae]|uniref:Transglutaminase domain-containing protein n=1 Tax=Chitinophaga oryzae TaxID=2725414 RepID=A0AAE6ZGK8_9BACT|nr:transglutaminase domain-containing protein [Chitinophaga oryzae]QJB32675.1 transglutaminase domain-containing protein [Chitinophaga oryzae]QJB39130.1 transglutaminase domain-containing protein [Chitinophaga oryzae]
MKSLPVFLVLAGLSASALAQQLPVIRATAKTVSIKDGPNFSKNTWTIEPATKPDIYITSAKKVVFYTDVDSISIQVKQDKPQDFYILLNGRDSALTRIQYQPPRLEMLKKAKKYNYADKREVSAFTYQSADDEVLKNIRRELKLDSIAGNGNEISQMINLMHWVHDIIRHDGNSNNPAKKNAVDIIGICNKEGRGVNCRMMATVLNECYLAMGFKSRFLTCMPKELKFDDCHVINMVYSTDKQKWLWMDPTFNAYVMNEKGELLGPAEVREKLINGKPLILNPDANWNRKNSTTKEQYLENYMAKNLYRLETPAASVYNAETGKWPAYVQLVPLDGLNQESTKADSTIKTGYRFQVTNNPDLFWVKP